MEEGPYLAVASGKFVHLFSICNSISKKSFETNGTIKFIHLLENHTSFPLFSKMEIPLLVTYEDGKTSVYDANSVNLKIDLLIRKRMNQFV
jgi:hypothetical protein